MLLCLQNRCNFNQRTTQILRRMYDFTQYGVQRCVNKIAQAISSPEQSKQPSRCCTAMSPTPADWFCCLGRDSPVNRRAIVFVMTVRGHLHHTPKVQQGTRKALRPAAKTLGGNGPKDPVQSSQSRCLSIHTYHCARGHAHLSKAQSSELSIPHRVSVLHRHEQVLQFRRLAPLIKNPHTCIRNIYAPTLFLISVNFPQRYLNIFLRVQSNLRLWRMAPAAMIGCLPMLLGNNGGEVE